ncbi:MAG TPA: glycosyltransferase family 4 protein [Candidatus Acidoferrales bacterium]
MRVLIYTHTFAPSRGGVETYVMLLAEGLSNFSKEGEEPVEVTIATQTPAGEMDDTRLPYRVVRRPRLLQLAKLIRAADVIHAAGPAFLALALGWLFRKPVIVEHSGYQSICPNGMLLYGPKRVLCPGHFMAGQYAECVRCNVEDWGRSRSIRGLLFTFPRRWLCRRVTFNVGPSQHIANRIALPKTEVIFHGIPPLPEPAALEVSRKSPNPICFAYVGRLVIEKGVSILLQAAHQLAQSGFDFRLRILGDGPERQNLENLAHELELQTRVEFLGSVPMEGVGDALGGADAVVMPSVWEDVAPLVAIEQMMRAKLVIGSDIGGLGEELGSTGLKFPAGDAAALAECMKRVIEDSELARQIGKAARVRALNLFTRDRMVQAHASMYRRALQC